MLSIVKWTLGNNKMKWSEDRGSPPYISLLGQTLSPHSPRTNRKWGGYDGHLYYLNTRHIQTPWSSVSSFFDESDLTRSFHVLYNLRPSDTCNHKRKIRKPKKFRRICGGATWIRLANQRTEWKKITVHCQMGLPPLSES